MISLHVFARHNDLNGNLFFSSETDEVRAKREPSLCNESVKRHFWFFFYTTAGSKFDNRRIGACEHRRGSSAARTEFTHCNSQWILDRHSYCFYLYTAAIEDQNLTIEDLVIVKQFTSDRHKASLLPFLYIAAIEDQNLTTLKRSY